MRPSKSIVAVLAVPSTGVPVPFVPAVTLPASNLIPSAKTVATSLVDCVVEVSVIFEPFAVIA